MSKVPEQQCFGCGLFHKNETLGPFDVSYKY